MADFPTENEFSMEEEFPTLESFDEQDRAIAWRNVEQDKPYKIIQQEVQPTKKGDGQIITLKSRDGVLVRAWATSLIRRDLEEKNKNDRLKDKVKYILSCGLETIRKD